jgi:hypothetical protein
MGIYVSRPTGVNRVMYPMVIAASDRSSIEQVEALRLDRERSHG